MIRHLAKHLDWWIVGVLEMTFLTIAWYARNWTAMAILVALVPLAALRGHLYYCVLPRKFEVEP